jgi:hypothetical protein
MKTLVYLTYGNKPEYQLELTYSVLSVVHFMREDPEDIQIALITTAENRRDDLPVKHIIIDETQLLHWTLDGKYSHAAKYFALVRAMDEYRGIVALVDTDTFFMAHPRHLFDRIGPGKSVMCDQELPLAHHSYYAGLLEKTKDGVAGYTVNGASAMRNSGVLGVDWSLRSVMEEVLELMSALHAIEPIHNVEQFAFSSVLERHTTVSVCPDLIRHYWGYDRRFVHVEVAKLFPMYSREMFERRVGEFRHLGMPEKPFLDRLRARLLRLFRGNNKQYSFAYLQYLCALSCRDAVVADAWANSALDAIVSPAVVWEAGELRHMARDFRLFRAERLASHPWLRP